MSRLHDRLERTGSPCSPSRADAPCGKNLEDTDTLASFDAYQIFGQTSLEPPKDDGEPARKESRKSDRPPNWEEIRDEALTALRTSKDLRLLAHLGAAVLRIDGIPAFARDAVGRVALAGDLLDPASIPCVDEDALFRQNALNCFADPVAVVDGLRRAPLVSSRSTDGSVCATSISSPGR